MALAVAALVVLNSAVGEDVSAGASGTPAPGAVSPDPIVATFEASVTWNGHNVSSASTVSSAFALAKGQNALVTFSYTGTNAASVANATLEVAYLGIVLATSRVTTTYISPPPLGTAHINWSFGNLYDALEGVFLLTASLLFANGSKAWSESFYVFAKAPYLLESAAVVIFLALAAAELYWGLSSIRDARRGRKPAPPTPWKGTTAPPEAPVGGAGPGPATAPPPATGGPPPAPPGASGSSGTGGTP
jgi:hypothetical protein